VELFRDLENSNGSRTLKDFMVLLAWTREYQKKFDVHANFFQYMSTRTPLGHHQIFASYRDTLGSMMGLIASFFMLPLIGGERLQKKTWRMLFTQQIWWTQRCTWKFHKYLYTTNLMQRKKSGHDFNKDLADELKIGFKSSFPIHALF